MYFYIWDETKYFLYFLFGNRNILFSFCILVKKCKKLLGIFCLIKKKIHFPLTRVIQKVLIHFKDYFSSVSQPFNLFICKYCRKILTVKGGLRWNNYESIFVCLNYRSFLTPWNSRNELGFLIQVSKYFSLNLIHDDFYSLFFLLNFVWENNFMTVLT